MRRELCMSQWLIPDNRKHLVLQVQERGRSQIAVPTNGPYEEGELYQRVPIEYERYYGRILRPETNTPTLWKLADCCPLQPWACIDKDPRKAELHPVACHQIAPPSQPSGLFLEPTAEQQHTTAHVDQVSTLWIPLHCAGYFVLHIVHK